MLTNFKSLLDLSDYFKEEKTCAEFLANYIWPNNSRYCPHCKSTKTYVTKSRSPILSKKEIPGYRCAASGCCKKFSVTTGTIFESSKVSLRIWYSAIYIILTSKKGINSHQLARQLHVTQRTAWFMNHRIRELFKQDAPDMLEGVVEVDEAYCSGKNSNRHYHKKINYALGDDEKIPIFGMVQRNGEARTFVVPNTAASTLQTLIWQNVKPGSIIISDSLNSYNGLSKIYDHKTVKHTKGNYATKDGLSSNLIENLWSTFKKGYVGVYQYMSSQHLQRYSDEFTHRYNRRFNDIMMNFTEAIFRSLGRRLKYSMLIASPRIEKNIVYRAFGQEYRRNGNDSRYAFKDSSGNIPSQPLMDPTQSFLDRVGEMNLFMNIDKNANARKGFGDGSTNNWLESL